MGFTEPSQKPHAMLLLIVLAILTVPWYARGEFFERLFLSIPVWVWSVIVFSITLVAGIMFVASRYWREG